MLVGYVSDEAYEVIADVAVHFERNGVIEAVVRSSPTGAVHADIESGTYQVTLARNGYGKKSTEVSIDDETVHQFRLLSTDMRGYVWPKWVQSGESGEFRVHTAEDTRISLWRYGRQKEEVSVVRWHDEHGPRPGLQLLPDGDFTQTGTAWNEIGYTNHSQDVVAPERSGLYFFHMRGKESGDFFAFPWVVAPAEPEADIAVLAGTNTWNAYNRFGGRSNYVNTTGLPETPVVHARADLDRFHDADVWGAENHDYLPLSFERPSPFNHVPPEQEVTDPIEGKEESHLAPAEWRFLGWLEEAGYGYDLYADYQLHDGTLDLDAYDALVVHTHPEYWSRQMYEQVKKWVFERGGRLAYLGGNGLNAEVEFIGPDRMRVYNDRRVVEAGDLHVETENGYESRFHYTVESEGTLLGVVYSESGLMTAAPYETLEPDHWVFEGTDLEAGDQFGKKTLQERVAGGASGHETDKLSKFAPAETTVLAKGTNPDEGGAEMSYYETDSGGAVFSVGSITYTAALFTDDDIARITANVLDCFIGDSTP